ncbi:protein FLX-like 1 [Phalaenopsis equestris]|uniref:protein FLX-like 1 n=1 Tax=Phalaenopsis equestris TaxID=78828 RepID=UPI0009E64966|nr:protein FLX-like 1 [Phalaenopsis equestris]
MSSRNRLAPHGMKGPPPGRHSSPPPFGSGLVPIPRPHHRHPALLDEMRDVLPPFAGGLRGPQSLPSLLIDERFAAQNQEIQGLLVDNQRLAATHVALKQELAAVLHELQRASHASGVLQAEREAEFRGVHERSMKMEAELLAADAIKEELIQVRGDIQKLNASKHDLSTQVQMLTQDLSRSSAKLQQAPAIKAEIEAMKQELQHARAAIEYEKKGYAENYEQGQVMERNLILMAREVEKLRAEVANAEKRARAAAAAGSQAAGYVGNYANPDPSYGGNSYPSSYGVNPVPGGADPGAQYGASSVPGHNSWSSYDVQRAHGRR